MTSPLVKRLQLLLSVVSVLVVLALGAAGWFYWQVRGSLAQLDGRVGLSGLSAPVKVERDALGVPRITGATRDDVARALGFLHAQDRFFQMDLLRRRAAGELAELFGPAALPTDRSARHHGLRRTAEQVVAGLDARHRAWLEAYVAGVNAGLAALPRQPWEYTVLRTAPRPWKIEDSVLCGYAMWFDLQDDTGHHDLNRQALRLAFGLSGLAFFSPRGNSADAALDGSTFPAPELPSLRLKPAEDQPTAALDPALVEPELMLGSNNFAVDGARSASGVAVLAGDMHLGHTVPTTWYRAELRWTDGGTARFAVGATLPGVPGIVAGSNGHLAWAFTNSNIDTSDVVTIETYADLQYRAPGGWRDIEDREEIIKVKGKPDEKLTVRWTEWGPLTTTAGEGKYYAVRWTAHDPAAQNFLLGDLDSVHSVAEALPLAHRIGMPNQNILLADGTGRIAWTLTGKIPRRVAFDGRLPVSWAYGDRKWDGWLEESQVPRIADPTEGILWTANNRIIGGEGYARLGESGYDNGYRAGAIRDDLRALVATKKVDPADLLGVQLDDRAPHLERWRKLLLDVLTDDAVAAKKGRRELREFARAWNGHAAIDSSGYRIIRQFRTAVFTRTLAPFTERARQEYDKFRWGTMVEDSVWQLVTERPIRLLNPEHRTWESLLLAAADDVLADADRANLTLANYTWGERNTLKMQHPFARFVPRWIGRFLSMPAEPLPGDSGVPRVQNATNGASQRLVVEPGREDHAIFHMPGGQSGHPLSPYFRAGHDDWAKGRPTPLLTGTAKHTLTLEP